MHVSKAKMTYKKPLSTPENNTYPKRNSPKLRPKVVLNEELQGKQFPLPHRPPSFACPCRSRHIDRPQGRNGAGAHDVGQLPLGKANRQSISASGCHASQPTLHSCGTAHARQSQNSKEVHGRLRHILGGQRRVGMGRSKGGMFLWYTDGPLVQAGPPPSQRARFLKKAHKPRARRWHIGPYTQHRTLEHD